MDRSVDSSYRRQFLRAAAVLSIAGTTGCLRLAGGGDSTPENETATDGISDTDGDGVIDSEDYAPRDPSVQRAEQVKNTPSDESTGTTSDKTQTTTVPNRGETVFVDTFEDNSFTDRWEYNNGPTDGISETDGLLQLNGDNGLLAADRFSAEGTLRFLTRMRTAVAPDQFDGFGFGIQFGPDATQGGITLLEDNNSQDGADDPEFDVGLKLHMWNPNSSRNPDVGLSQLTETTNWRRYAFTVDFDSQRVISATRGSQSFDVSFALDEIYAPTFRLIVGNGTDHRVRHEKIQITRLE